MCLVKHQDNFTILICDCNIIIQFRRMFFSRCYSHLWYRRGLSSVDSVMFGDFMNRGTRFTATHRVACCGMLNYISMRRQVEMLNTTAWPNDLPARVAITSSCPTTLPDPGVAQTRTRPPPQPRRSIVFHPGTRKPQKSSVLFCTLWQKTIDCFVGESINVFIALSSCWGGNPVRC